MIWVALFIFLTCALIRDQVKSWFALFIFLICALIRDQVKHGSLSVYISNLCLDQGSSKGWFALYIFLICALFRDQVKEQNRVLSRAKDMEKQVLELIDRKSILENPRFLENPENLELRHVLYSGSCHRRYSEYFIQINLSRY